VDECQPLVTGRDNPLDLLDRLRRQAVQGKAVQVDPIKPVLKAPGSVLLKLRNYGVLSDFAFNFNLRHYIKGLHIATTKRAILWGF